MNIHFMTKHFKKLNLNPSGDEISDCTTRALCFCLNKDDYDAIRRKQDEIAVAVSGKKSDWQAYYVFESFLFSKGWLKIVFPKKIVRWKLAEMLKDHSVKLLTESYGHVSPIWKGFIWDTWDCSRGRVAGLMYPDKSQKELFKTLDVNNIQYVLD